MKHFPSGVSSVLGGRQLEPDGRLAQGLARELRAHFWPREQPGACLGHSLPFLSPHRGL